MMHDAVKDLTKNLSNRIFMRAIDKFEYTIIIHIIGTDYHAHLIHDPIFTNPVFKPFKLHLRY